MRRVCKRPDRSHLRVVDGAPCVDAVTRWLIFCVAVAVVTAVFTLSATGEVAIPPRRAAVALSGVEVASALNAQGIVVNAAQITMLADVVAARGDSLLEVKSLERWDSVRNRVELGCHRSGECLSFYVFVQWPNATEAAKAIRIFNHAGNGAGDVPPEHGDATLPGVRRAQAGPVLKSGARATLVIDQGRLHIRVPVICLESGRAGGMVRVQSRDHRQIYLAQVLDGSSLKGSLQ